MRERRREGGEALTLCTRGGGRERCQVARITAQEAYKSLSNHVLLIGVASVVLLACMVYNLATSVSALCAIWLRKKR
eukprot:jgi/Mesen1/10820/ME000093S10330